VPSHATFHVQALNSLLAISCCAGDVQYTLRRCAAWVRHFIILNTVEGIE
jgi:hypothetical protein